MIMFLICSYRVLYGEHVRRVAKTSRFESFPLEAGGVAAGRRHGRGAQTNRSGRFEPIAYEPVDDGWESLGELEALSTEVQEVPARRIITRNESPDIGFDRSINPYRGCEHGCIYCFARPTHAFLGLSPGLDFETKLFAKTNAAQALERELAEPGYQVRDHRHRHQHRPLSADRAALPHHAPHPRSLERGQPSGRHRHQVGAGAARSRPASARWPSAAWSKWRCRSPRSTASLPAPWSRARARPTSGSRPLQRLVEAGVPTSVMVAPVIPGLTDMEMERILERARRCRRQERGLCAAQACRSRSAICSPNGCKANCPDRANRVLSLMRSTRGGKLYDAKWGERMMGDGPYAWMIGRQIRARRRAARAQQELGRAAHRPVHARPSLPGQQLRLF